MTATDIPIVFLDVDGVVNAIGADQSDLKWSIGHANPSDGWSRSFQIRWDQTIIDRLKKLHDEGRLEIRWLTTWGNGANGELRALIGLDELVVARHPSTYDMNGRGGGWWKQDYVEFFLASEEGSRKIIWVDDELGWNREASKWAEDNGILVIGPPEYTGLTHEMLDSIEEFIDA